MSSRSFKVLRLYFYGRKIPRPVETSFCVAVTQKTQFIDQEIY